VRTVKVLDEGFDSAELTEYLNELASEPGIGIALITEPIIASYGMDQFEKVRKTLNEKLIIIVIPDSKGSRSKIGEGHLMKIIRRAIGQKRSN
jgi:vacuolar-type H+-ATPase subunit F/Vma7